MPMAELLACFMVCSLFDVGHEGCFAHPPCQQEEAVLHSKDQIGPEMRTRLCVWRGGGVLLGHMSQPWSRRMMFLNRLDPPPVTVSNEWHLCKHVPDSDFPLLQVQRSKSFNHSEIERLLDSDPSNVIGDFTKVSLSEWLLFGWNFSYCVDLKKVIIFYYFFFSSASCFAHSGWKTPRLEIHHSRNCK